MRWLGRSGLGEGEESAGIPDLAKEVLLLCECVVILLRDRDSSGSLIRRSASGVVARSTLLDDNLSISAARRLVFSPRAIPLP